MTEVLIKRPAATIIKIMQSGSIALKRTNPIIRQVTKQTLIKIVGYPVRQYSKNYTHTQTLASTTWNIAHNMNKKPSVTIVDSADNTVYGDITYIDLNNVTINFTAAFSGKAYLT